VGILVALVVAADVFLGGMAILPPVERGAPEPEQAPPPAPPPPATPPAAATPPPAAASDGAALAAAADGAASAAADAGPAATPTPPSSAAAGSPDAGAGGKTREAPAAAAPERRADHADREKSSDRDVAREAWRRNLPDITVDKGKASILIPIKGSIDGATYHVTAKPRSVIVSLPQGESMITMRYYRIKHDGFRQLWIKQEDGEGTTLRVVLDSAYDPLVEIKEDFVRVTVRHPEEAAPAAAEQPASPDVAEP
jgi:hypothetical protein